MRIRESLIIEETILKKIDEIAGEKNRRAAVIEIALSEYIAREEAKPKKNLPPTKKTPPKGLNTVA